LWSASRGTAVSGAFASATCSGVTEPALVVDAGAEAADVAGVKISGETLEVGNVEKAGVVGNSLIDHT
jgi:hypothetical protein